MSPILCLSLLRHWRSHPGQLLLAVLGITLGVAVVLAVDLANTSARKSFEQSMQQMTGSASHRIFAAADALAESVYVDLRVKHGVRAIAPVVQGYAADRARPGKLYQVLGVDIFAEAPFRDYFSPLADDGVIASGAANLMTSDNSAIFPRDAGNSSTLELLAGEQSLTLHAAGRFNNPAFDGLIITDIATAQVLFGMRGRLSHIDVRLGDDDAGRALADRLSMLLTDDLLLEETAESNRANAELSAAFSLNLTALSLLALVVGMFLIYNTMTFSVVQRRMHLGILRAIGVGQGELRVLVLGEAALLGLIGTLLGILLGVWLGSKLVYLVTRTVNDLYYVSAVNAFQIAPWSLLKGSLLGMLVTVFAAALPANEAAKAPASTVLSRAFLEARWRAKVPKIAAIGAVLLSMSVLVFCLSDSLLWALVGVFFLLLGFALLTPGLLVLALRIGNPLILRAGLITAMSMRGIVRHLSRTGVAITALMVAFAATVGIAVMIDSFRSGVVLWIGDLLQADIYVSPLRSGGAGAGSSLDEEVLQRLQTLPGVREVAFYQRIATRLGKDNPVPVALVAADLNASAKSGYQIIQGDPTKAWDAFDRGVSVLISEPLAYRQHLHPGADLELSTPAGVRTFSVAGIFRDYGSERGRILLSRAAYLRYWQDQQVSSAALYLEPGQDLAQAREDIFQRLGVLQALNVRANRELVDLTIAVFDRTFTITNVLRLLAIVVAFTGVLSALMALQMERAREFAVLRALGLTARDIGRLVLTQTATMGVLAGILAIPLGLLLSAALIFAINKRAFGWTFPFQIDYWILLQTVAFSLIAALLAGLYPIWRMRRVDLAQDLRTE